MKNQAVIHGMEAVGVLMPDGGRFRFVAVKFSVWALDGSLHDTPAAARIAVQAHFAGRTKAVSGESDPHDLPTATGEEPLAGLRAAVGE